jgi:arylsulfatase A-like enzyme
LPTIARHNLPERVIPLEEDRTMRKRKLPTLLALVVALSCLVGICRAAEHRGPRPNIIYIMSDDHAAHALSCYGSKINNTPNLDRLASGGILFANCFCTNSICAPCRAVVLTGKYSHLNGVIDNTVSFDGSQQTVAKLLRKAGYQTAMIGKWHLKSEPTGFDYWQVLQGQGPYYNPAMRTPEGLVKHVGYTTDVITDLVLDFLKNKREQNKPFFVMYHHKAPHRNWQPGPGYFNLYDGVTIPEPDNLFDDYSGRGTAAGAQEMTVAKHLDASDLKLKAPGGLTKQQRAAWDEAYDPKNKAFQQAHLQGKDLVRWKYQRYIKDYLRCIASVDDNVGRLLDYLDETGLAASTIVFYTSDQGFYLGDHGWFDKRFMYEESLRSPLLVRWPGRIKPGTKSDAIVLNLDFAETFLDCAGVQIPGDMQGRSLLPILEGNAPADWRQSMYYRYYEFPAVHMVNKHYGVRTERYKLIFFHELGEWELYDLQTDPREMKSVYSDPAYAHVVKELKAELARLRGKYKDEDGVGVSPAGSRR